MLSDRHCLVVVVDSLILGSDPHSSGMCGLTDGRRRVLVIFHGLDSLENTLNLSIKSDLNKNIGRKSCYTDSSNRFNSSDISIIVCQYQPDSPNNIHKHKWRSGLMVTSIDYSP